MEFISHFSIVGALSFGGDGAWMDLAESKLRRDNKVDYQVQCSGEEERRGE